MNKGINVLLGVIILGFLVIVSGAVYVVDETQQVVITRFGEPIGSPITEAGLHFKIPFLHTVNYFDKRILQWDGDAKQIQTLEKRYIWVDTTARWRIVDALNFMRTVRTESNAQGRLDLIINSATRNIVASHILAESVRNTNRLIDNRKKSENIVGGLSHTELERIENGRDGLSRRILSKGAKETSRYGIELVDVRIKRLNYIEDVRKKVYQRMIAERNQAAEQFRSEGEGKKAEIQGQMSKELQKIRAQAYKKSQEIKGGADAKVIKIYAQAYNKDPEFYTFVRTLESYRKTMGSHTTLILSTDNDYYNQIRVRNPKGK